MDVRNRINKICDQIEEEALTSGKDPAFGVSEFKAFDGTLLKDLRTVLGISQKEVAAHLRISSPGLSGHEKRGNVNEKTLNRYLDALDLEPNVFDCLRIAIVASGDSLEELLEDDDFLKKMIKNRENTEDQQKKEITEDINKHLIFLEIDDLKTVLKIVTALSSDGK